MNTPIYKLFSLDGKVAGYYRGELRPGSVVYAENMWMPDGSRPRPDDPVPKGVIFSTNHVRRIDLDQAPEFMRGAITRD